MRFVVQCTTMIKYEDQVRKCIEKGKIPRHIFQTFHNAFKSIELTKDLNLFDIKEVKGNLRRTYYRMRKGKYRAIFFIDADDILVIHIGKRDEVYKLWR